jgi:protein SCO1/2
VNRISLIAMLGAGVALAQGPQLGVPAMLKGVGIEQRLNAQLPLEARFTDESGASVRFGQYFHGKPVILALVYYRCPMLCNLELSGLVSSLQKLKLEPGRDFEVVALSFDPRETPDLASAKRENYLRKYNRPQSDNGWHFLVGNETAIHQVTGAVGFDYRWDPIQKQWAHASAIVVATPEGHVSRYFYGVAYNSRDLRFGLMDASNHQIGNLADEIILYCYHYDPKNGKYGFAIVNTLRVVGCATVLALGCFIVANFRRENQERQKDVLRDNGRRV